jgi:hypothetical protein
MKYQVVFTSGVVDDIESLMKELKCDVLLLDEIGNCFELHFITIDRIRAEFSKEQVCYLEENMVILHTITKENILKSIPELHSWGFTSRWSPLPFSQVEEYYFPKENWVVFDIKV